MERQWEYLVTCPPPRTSPQGRGGSRFFGWSPETSILLLNSATHSFHMNKLGPYSSQIWKSARKGPYIPMDLSLYERKHKNWKPPLSGNICSPLVLSYALWEVTGRLPGALGIWTALQLWDLLSNSPELLHYYLRNPALSSLHFLHVRTRACVSLTTGSQCISRDFCFVFLFSLLGTEI